MQRACAVAGAGARRLPGALQPSSLPMQAGAQHLCLVRDDGAAPVLCCLAAAKGVVHTCIHHGLLPTDICCSPGLRQGCAGHQAPCSRLGLLMAWPASARGINTHACHRMPYPAPPTAAAGSAEAMTRQQRHRQAARQKRMRPQPRTTTVAVVATAGTKSC